MKADHSAHPYVGPAMSLSLSPAHLTRYRQIAGLLVRHGRGDLVRSSGLSEVLEDEPASDRVEADAERLAADLEAMGPTFVKLGQLMSSRVDLISPAYVEALSRLQDDVEPFGLEQVEDIVSSELQVRLRSVYAEFDPVPMAAASIGQVHRARLRDGREVVVKVQRPGVRERIRDDMEVLADLAGLLDRHTDAGRRFGFADLLEEFRKVLVDELDYRREADNLARVRELVAGRDLLVVPAPVPELTTGRVLTMEYVEGRKITDIGPLGRMDLDGAALADELFAAYLDQVLDQGVFHADPHPGNVLVTPDGRLVLLDIGMIARIAPSVRDHLVKLLLALADARPEEVARIAMHPGSVQGFGQLGPDGVPVFLLPANPVSALVVFEMMVRPLIRLSLGKRQPMRRIVQARALSPITSVAGRKGFLRGQLMRDQDTGEYLVQALGGAPGASSHLLATLAEANCLVVVPSDADQIRTGEVVDVAFLAQRG